MKTLISLDIHARGITNHIIYGLIEQINSGEAILSKSDFFGSIRMTGQIAGVYIDIFPNENDIAIHENDVHTLTLHFKEIHELKESELNEPFPLDAHILNLTNKLS